MIVPMPGRGEVSSGELFLVERLYWKGRPLPLGRLSFRWLRTRRERGYDYPGKRERDVLGLEERAA